jgi:hypothetical protein
VPLQPTDLFPQLRYHRWSSALRLGALLPIGCIATASSVVGGTSATAAAAFARSRSRCASRTWPRNDTTGTSASAPCEHRTPSGAPALAARPSPGRGSAAARRTHSAPSQSARAASGP